MGGGICGVDSLGHRNASEGWVEEGHALREWFTVIFPLALA